MPENDDRPQFKDENFIVESFLLIECGINSNGNQAFRFKHTMPSALAIGAMTQVGDVIREVEKRGWFMPDDDDEDDGEEYAE